jgi:hypothetical protein
MDGRICFDYQAAAWCAGVVEGKEALVFARREADFSKNPGRISNSKSSPGSKSSARLRLGDSLQVLVETNVLDTPTKRDSST